MVTVEVVRASSTAEIFDTRIDEEKAEVTFLIQENGRVHFLTIKQVGPEVKIKIDNVTVADIYSPELAQIVRDLVKQTIVHRLRRFEQLILAQFREVEEFRRKLEEFFTKIEQAIDEAVRREFEKVHRILSFAFRIIPVSGTEHYLEKAKYSEVPLF